LFSISLFLFLFSILLNGQKYVIPVHAAAILLYVRAKWHPSPPKPFSKWCPGDRGVCNLDDRIREVRLYYCCFYLALVYEKNSTSETSC